MVLGQGLALALAGAAVGLAGAFIVSHVMAGLLYGVSPSDPLTFISLTVVLVMVALRPATSPRAAPCGSTRSLLCAKAELSSRAASLMRTVRLPPCAEGPGFEAVAIYCLNPQGHNSK